jgi:hypothetical protein
MANSPLNLIVENTNNNQIGGPKYEENAKQLKNSRRIRSKKYIAYAEKSKGRPHSVQRTFNSIANNQILTEGSAILTES